MKLITAYIALRLTEVVLLELVRVEMVLYYLGL